MAEFGTLLRTIADLTEALAEAQKSAKFFKERHRKAMKRVMELEDQLNKGSVTDRENLENLYQTVMNLRAKVQQKNIECAEQDIKADYLYRDREEVKKQLREVKKANGTLILDNAQLDKANEAFLKENSKLIAEIIRIKL